MDWGQGIFFRVLVLGLFACASAHAQQPGATTFAANCAGCHGADGRGGEHAPNIAGAPAVQQLTDGELGGIVHNGIAGAGMPAFPSFTSQQIADVVSYLRILQGRGDIVKLPGDPAQGKTLFFGKAQCSDCHMVDGKGGFLGSELSYFGAGVQPDAIRAVILNPEKSLGADKKAVTVATRKGETFTGQLKIQDNFSLSLQMPDGSYRFFPKTDLVKTDIGSRSLMPAATGLTTKEVDDLVSYLMQAGNENSKHTPHPAKSDDDDN
jgi:cytochrome c oxidase cbb3-type subunit III